MKTVIITTAPDRKIPVRITGSLPEKQSVFYEVILKWNRMTLDYLKYKRQRLKILHKIRIPIGYEMSKICLLSQIIQNKTCNWIEF